MTPLDAKAVLDAVPDAVVAADADGRILDLNPAAERLLWWRAADLAGAPLDRILPLRSPGRVQALRKDGTAIEVELALSTHGTLLIAVLRTLPAGMAHEITNPLVYVTLGLELIERELGRMEAAATAADWERLRGYCKDAIGGAQRVSTIVRELRGFSRPVEEREAPAGAGKVPQSPAPSARRPRLLLIDDEPHLGVTLSTGLRDQADVVAVRSGGEAIALLLGDEEFDLILCDLMMPDLTGMDVFETVAGKRPGLRGRFVFTTGGAVTERAQKFIEQMPDRRLDKPFRLEQVEALLKQPPG